MEQVSWSKVEEYLRVPQVDEATRQGRREAAQRERSAEESGKHCGECGHVFADDEVVCRPMVGHDGPFKFSCRVRTRCAKCLPPWMKVEDLEPTELPRDSPWGSQRLLCVPCAA